MSCTSRPEAWGVLLLALLRAVPVAAQGWTETQVMGVAVASEPVFAGGGAGVAWRDAGRTRLGAALAAGVLDNGEAAGRVELVWHFLLDPARARGGAVYGGGGLAVATGPAGDPAARIQLVLGVEAAPGSRHGAFVEAGVGGGVRLAAGLRWRARGAARRAP